MLTVLGFPVSLCQADQEKGWTFCLKAAEDLPQAAFCSLGRFAENHQEPTWEVQYEISSRLVWGSSCSVQAKPRRKSSNQMEAGLGVVPSCRVSTGRDVIPAGRPETIRGQQEER